MSQFSLPFSTPPLYRISDPATSRTAADKAASFLAKHEERILGALRDAGKKGMTYREIAAATGLEPVAVARRLKGMERRGLITRSALYDCSGFSSRNGMAIWWAT